MTRIERLRKGLARLDGKAVEVLCTMDRTFCGIVGPITEKFVTLDRGARGDSDDPIEPIPLDEVIGFVQQNKPAFT